MTDFRDTAAVDAETRPWGVLQGVRPGKLAHKLADGGVALEALPRYLREHYLLSEGNARLLTNICALQRRLLAGYNREAAIYIGVPFCPSICGYCSFPSGIVPQDEESQQNFVNYIEHDIENVVKLLSMQSFGALPVVSLYIGGGTPVSLAERPFARLLQLARRAFGSLPLKEFTVEAGRPDCITAGKLHAMEAAGVSRVSVNPQTLHDKTLALIGRGHTAADFYRSYELARQSKIPDVNMDLIIGLPGETAADVMYSLKEARSLAPDNLTVHTLALKKRAAMFGGSWTQSMDACAAAELVAAAGQIASGMGMRPYYLYRQHYMLGQLANIGYALPGKECLYNIQMMEERHTVLGIGPSAATKVPLPDGHHLRKLYMPHNLPDYMARQQELFAKRAGLFEGIEGGKYADHSAERH